MVSVLAVNAGAEEDLSDRWEADPKDVINFKVGVLNPSFTLTTDTGKSPDSSPVMFTPSPVAKYFFGGSYRNLGAAISFSSAPPVDQTTKFGNGHSLDFLFSVFGRKITQQYFYQDYKGYYISNTDVVNPAIPAGTYIVRPDISTQHYGANFIYNFHPHKYSRAVAFDQSGRQKQNGGALLGMLGVHNHRFSSSPQLLPLSMTPKYGELGTLQSGDIMQLSLLVGGGYNWVFQEGWYASAELLYGGGFAYQRFETADYVYKQSTGNTAANLSFSLGFNGLNNYFALQALSDNYYYKFPDMNMQTNSLQVSFHYGHRFAGVGAPFLDKASSWLD